MDSATLMECLRLLDAADRLLIDSGEWVLSAHLQAAIEPIRGHVVGLDGADFMASASRNAVDGSMAPTR